MKNYLLLLSLVIGLSGCFLNDDEEDCATNSCEYFTEPEYIDFEINVSLNNENTYVIYEVYKGLYDELNISNHLLTDTAYYNYSTLSLPIGRHTFKAIYNRNGDNVWVFDSAKSKRKHYNCIPECWSTENGAVNLKLN